MTNKADQFLPNQTLNVAIAFGAYAVAIAALWFASHAQTWWAFALAVFVFSQVGNTIFGLLHESVHRAFSKNKSVNYWFGVVSAAFFPTSYTFQRTCHLGHHMRNRTDHEMFDMYYPDDNKFLKFSQFYSILTGIYWLTIPLGCLLYLVFPQFYALLSWMRKRYPAIASTGAVMMEPFVNHPDQTRIRLEMLFAVLLHAGLFYALNLNAVAWLACYWVFGMFWGGLQYADHAWSERDIRSGAWNLKVNPITRLIHLNYHHHKAHHMHPNVPWNHLPKFVDYNEYRPSFLRIWLKMWLGPTATKKKLDLKPTSDFKRLVYEG